MREPYQKGQYENVRETAAAYALLAH